LKYQTRHFSSKISDNTLFFLLKGDHYIATRVKRQTSNLHTTKLHVKQVKHVFLHIYKLIYRNAFQIAHKFPPVIDPRNRKLCEGPNMNSTRARLYIL